MRRLSRHSSRRIATTSRVATRLPLVVLSLTFTVASAQGIGREFRWDELQKQGRSSVGTVLPPAAGSPGHQLKVESRTPTPSTVTVLTVDKPAVAGPRYVLRGQVRYENVEGSGYLELWNHFPGG